MDEGIFDYELGQLSSDERGRVAALIAANPSARAKSIALRQLLNRLNADRGDIDPPKGLALSAIARVAEEIAGLPKPAPAPAKPNTWADDRPTIVNWLPRADLLVAACIAFVFLGLLFPTIQKYRRNAQTVACAENLHEMHTGLAGYADVNAGRFPQVGTENVPVAGAFAAELARAGQLPASFKPNCPTDGLSNEIGYSYSLGYRNRFGEIIGPRLPDPESASEYLPIAADRPAPPAHGGWNVLCAGGSVRYTTTPILGNPNDDLFHNDDKEPRAGLHRFDVSLGRPHDRP